MSFFDFLKPKIQQLKKKLIMQILYITINKQSAWHPLPGFVILDRFLLNPLFPFVVPPSPRLFGPWRNFLYIPLRFPQGANFKSTSEGPLIWGDDKVEQKHIAETLFLALSSEVLLACCHTHKTF